MSLGNPTFDRFVVGRAFRLPLNDLPTQAGRLRYISDVQKQAAFGIIPQLRISPSSVA
jgi:hypothetical protein